MSSNYINVRDLDFSGVENVNIIDAETDIGKAIRALTCPDCGRIYSDSIWVEVHRKGHKRPKQTNEGSKVHMQISQTTNMQELIESLS